MAAAAATAFERSDGQTAVLSQEFAVEGCELVGKAGSNIGSIHGECRSALVKLGDLAVAFGDQLFALNLCFRDKSCDLASRRAGFLERLHQFEFVIFERRDAAFECCDLVLQISEIFRVRHCAGVQAVFIARTASLDQLDFLLLFLQRTFQIADLSFRSDATFIEPRQLGVEFSDLFVFRQVLLPMRQLGQFRIKRLHI